MNFDKTKNRKIHSRKIEITTYEGGSPDSFIVEGVLKDDRLMDSYRPTGQIKPVGTIHHMIIRLEVKGPNLLIEDIQVEMPTLPNEFCIETMDCLDPIKGMSIVSGFTSKVKNVAGGVKGCVHLLALLTTMAPAAFQGVFSVMEKDLNPSFVEDRLKNTCRVWRENGPIMNRFKK